MIVYQNPFRHTRYLDSFGPGHVASFQFLRETMGTIPEMYRNTNKYAVAGAPTALFGGAPG